MGVLTVSGLLIFLPASPPKPLRGAMQSVPISRRPLAIGSPQLSSVLVDCQVIRKDEPSRSITHHRPGPVRQPEGETGKEDTNRQSKHALRLKNLGVAENPRPLVHYSN